MSLRTILVAFSTVVLILNGMLLWTVFGYFDYISSGSSVSAQYKPLVKLYGNIEKNLGGKNFYSETNESFVIEKNIYYLNGQIITGIITTTDGKKATQTYPYSQLVKNKDKIETIEITEINNKPVNGSIIFKGSELKGQEVLTIVE